jgi:predicted lipoprotein with Yx(FWY)xxD motif
MLKTKARIGLCAAIATAVAAPAVAVASSSTTIGSGKVKAGTVVVNSSGLTLYSFAHDSKNKSTCYGACAKVWIPLTTTGSVLVKSGSGLSQTLVGKAKRTDGTTQVTYNGHPLYHYTGDTKPGQQNGQNKMQFGARWYVVGKNGKWIKPGSGLVGGY